MRISVAMTTYNGARFIEEQLQSLAAQTRLTDELVVSDDGSADETLAIVARFADHVRFPVHVHRNRERLGYSRNFEAAIARCTGDLIFLCDQDDVWFPDKLETVSELFDSDDHIQVVINGQIITDANLSHRGVTMLDNVRRLGKSKDALVEGCATAFRQPWGTLLLPIPAEAAALVADKELSHDLWLNELSALLGVRLFHKRPLQYFRRHGDNVTQWLGNRPEPVGLADLVATRVKQAPISAWERRASVLDLYDRWLIKHDARLSGIGSVAGARAKLANEARSIRQRVELNRAAPPRRLAGALLLWLSGGYRYFNGWKSALRDITRLS